MSFRSRNCLPFAITCSLSSPRLVLSVAYPSQALVLWVLPVWCCLLLTLHKHLFSGFSPFGVVCCLPFASTCFLGSPRLVLSVLLIFLHGFLCCVLFFFVLCLVFPMLSVSLDCPIMKIDCPFGFLGRLFKPRTDKENKLRIPT